MKVYEVTFFKVIDKEPIFWKEIIETNDIATDVWLNNSLYGTPYNVKQLKFKKKYILSIDI